LIGEVGDQVSLSGSYLPPLPRNTSPVSTPPHTITLVPVQIALAPTRKILHEGEPVRLVGDHASVIGS
jgi:hypothetical protein